MAERPILFSGPLVRAILAGRKTETRRLIKPALTRRSIPVEGGDRLVWAWDCKAVRAYIYPELEPEVMACNAKIQPGDVLWVRESWRTTPGLDGYKPSDLPTSAPLMYEADGFTAWSAEPKWGKGRPSIFMPRWASRIRLRVTEVCAERVQDITEAGAKAEGIAPTEIGIEETEWLGLGRDDPRRFERKISTSARADFAELWDEINGKREGASWEANPWVWKYKFEVLP